MPTYVTPPWIHESLSHIDPLIAPYSPPSLATARRGRALGLIRPLPLSSHNPHHRCLPAGQREQPSRHPTSAQCTSLRAFHLSTGDHGIKIKEWPEQGLSTQSAASETWHNGPQHHTVTGDGDANVLVRCVSNLLSLPSHSYSRTS